MHKAGRFYAGVFAVVLLALAVTAGVGVLAAAGEQGDEDLKVFW